MSNHGFSNFTFLILKMKDALVWGQGKGIRTINLVAVNRPAWRWNDVMLGSKGRRLLPQSAVRHTMV